MQSIRMQRGISGMRLGEQAKDEVPFVLSRVRGNGVVNIAKG